MSETRDHKNDHAVAFSLFHFSVDGWNLGTDTINYWFASPSPARRTLKIILGVAIFFLSQILAPWWGPAIVVAFLILWPQLGGFLYALSSAIDFMEPGSKSKK